MNFAERIAEKKRVLDEQKAALSQDDLDEISSRAEMDRIDSEIAAEKQKASQLDLDRRMDAARESLGPNAAIMAVMVQGYDDTFIVKRNQSAHSRWLEGTSRAAINKEGKEPVNRAYAAAVVYDWNGRIGVDTDTQFHHEITKFLTENVGVVTPITNAAAELAGVFARERKS